MHDSAYCNGAAESVLCIERCVLARTPRPPTVDYADPTSYHPVGTPSIGICRISGVDASGALQLRGRRLQLPWCSWWTTPWHDESFCMQLDIVHGRSYAPQSMLCFYGSACTVRAHSSCPGHVDGSSGDVRSVFGSRV